jgi:hypothetical protein
MSNYHEIGHIFLLQTGEEPVSLSPSVNLNPAPSSSAGTALMIGGVVILALLWDAKRKKGLWDPRGPRVF